MTHTSLDDLILQATCSVLREGQIVGTAWLLSADGYLLTAAHVVGREAPLEEVMVRFVDHEEPLVARVEEWHYQFERGIDFAVLKLEQPIERRPLPIALARKCEGTFHVRGYGRSFSRTGSQWGRRGQFEAEQTVQHSTSDLLFVLDASELKERGFSGGAVYSVTPKAVVAIMIKGAPLLEKLVVALPLYRMAEYWPKLTEIAQQKNTRDPYVGLQTFGEEDADVFYGRESLVERLVEKVAHSPFLAVLGPSGSGKSSLIRAGLVPALKKGALPGSSQWNYLIIKPTQHPLDALAAALNKLQAGNLGQLRRVLDENERDMARTDTYALLAESGNTETRLVLVVDQFEELWTLAPTEPDARASFVREKQKPFIELLLSAIGEQSHAAAPSLLIILTMRADFLHRAAENRDLANAIAEALEIVSPMQPDELRRAISEPLKTVDGVFERGLVDELITQTSQREGALPLLQYTLAELWQAAEPNPYGTPTMTWDAYRALGGVEGALAQRADTILQQQYTDEQQQQLRHLLVRLVQPGEGAADTRRRIPLAELVPAGSDIQDVQHLLNPLVNKRLLTTGRDPTTGQQTVEVAHEALIRAWPTLSEWIEEARKDLRFHLQLEESAKEWQTHNQNPDFLWSGLRLANAKEWLERTQPQLNERDQRFLHASRDAEAARIAREEAAQREREQLLEARAAADRRNASRLRLFLAVGSVLLVVALILAGLAFNGQQQATNTEKTAVAEANRAESAATQEAIARQDAEEQTNRAESAATQEAIARKDAEEQTNRAELAATQEAIARKDAEEQTNRAGLAATQEAIARQDAEEQTKWAESAATQEAIARKNAEEQTKRAESAATQEAIARDEEVKARQEAEAQARIAQIQANAAQALFELSNDQDDRALLFALASIPNQSEDYPPIAQRAWRQVVDQTLIRHTLRGHTDVVNSVAFSSDGQLLLTGSWDNTARLWKAKSGRLLHSLQGHTSDVWSVVFSPDGQSFLTGSSDNTARLWEVESGQLLYSLQGHTSDVWSGAFSPDGSLILTGSDDETARLWKAETGQLLHTLKGHTSDVWSVAFSPAGQLLLTGSDDGTARLWKTENGQLLYSLEGHTLPVRTVAFTPDGQQILTGSSDGTARLWEVESGRLLHSLEGHTDIINSVAFSPNGQRLLTHSEDGTVRLWEVESGQLLHSLEGHTDRVWSVAFAPDGQQILTGSADETARLWETESGQFLHSFEGHTSTVLSVAFNPDTQLLLTSSSDKTARLWKAKSGQLFHSLEGHTAPVGALAFSPDGKRLLTGSIDNTARFWETESGQLLYSLEGHTGAVWSVAFSPDGGLLLTGSVDNTARLWETESGQLLHTLEGHTDTVWSVLFSPNAKLLLTGSSDGTARLWESESGQLLYSLEGHTDVVRPVAFSPDTKLLLTGSSDGTARLWETESGQLLHSLEGHTEAVISVAFSPDGKSLLTGSYDGTARLWESKSGQLLYLLEGHTSDVNSVAFSPDGQLLLTGSSDRSARIWQAKSGQFVHSLEGHTDAVVEVAFAPDGNSVLTGSSDGTARLWLVDNEQIVAALIERTCNVLTEKEIRDAMPEWREWRGCEAELEAVAKDLAAYHRWVGEE